MICVAWIKSIRASPYWLTILLYSPSRRRPSSPSRRSISSLSFAPHRPEISSRVASRGAAPEASQALEKSRRIRGSLADAAAVTSGGGDPRSCAPSTAAGFGGHTLPAVLRAERGMHSLTASGDARRLAGIAARVAIDLSAFYDGSGGRDGRLCGGSA